MTLYDAFGDDWSGCIEELFTLIHTNLVFCPQKLSEDTETLDNLINLTFLSLHQVRERESIRCILRAVQGLFNPTTAKNSSSAGLTILLHSCAMGAQFVALLLHLLFDGGLSSSLVPNLAETFQAIITGCNTSSSASSTGSDGYGTQPVSLIMQCKIWFHSALPPLLERVQSLQLRGRIAEAVVALGEKRDRRLKTLFQDLAKIAAGELTEDALLAYDEY